MNGYNNKVLKHGPWEYYSNGELNLKQYFI